MNTVVKMARAIEHAALAWGEMQHGVSPHTLSVLMALHALKAIREPDETMKVNGGIAIEQAMFGGEKIVFDTAGDCFTAMIDAAIQEHEG